MSSGTSSLRAIDIVTVSPVSQVNVAVGSLLPGVAALAGEEGKRADWEGVASREGLVVVPFAYELGGRFGKRAHEFIREVSSVAESTPIGRLLFAGYWTRRIADLLLKVLEGHVGSAVKEPGSPAAELKNERAAGLQSRDYAITFCTRKYSL